MTTNTKAFECPITLTTMESPVLATDGYTYERDAITQWLLEHGTSPQTREPMSAENLLPNRAIADLIARISLSKSRSDIETETPDIDGASDVGSDSACVNNENNIDSDSESDSNSDSDSQSDSNGVNATTNTGVKKDTDKKRGYLPKELESVTKSTHATLRLVHSNNINDTEPLSTRVHIKTPNPSVKKVDKYLTTPNHICCVIDVSGSMGLSATSKDEYGNTLEDVGLSILDIVKFSTQVIAQSLNPQDKLSIVTYGDRATTVLHPTPMTPQGKKNVKFTLDSMRLQSRTNLFAGIKLGIMEAHEVGDEYINSVFVLTDGVPTEHPPLGYERSIAKVLSKNPIFGTLSTFGFGYQLDSKLLVDIANIGGGSYSFIPDAGMVGTCFINAVANCRCAYGIQPVLRISGCDTSRLTKPGVITGTTCRRSSNNGHVEKWSGGKSKSTASKVVLGLTLDGRLETTVVDGIIYIRLNSLRYGSDIDVVLRPLLFKHNADNIEIKLIFDIVGGQTMHLDVFPSDADGADELFHYMRAQFVRTAFDMCLNPYGTSNFASIMNSIKIGNRGNVKLEALNEDVIGQATEAIAENKQWDRWGKHFLFSLSTAHLHQFCNNFKDPGVQTYGEGTLFQSLQNSLDDIFGKVAPPVPSIPLPKSSLSLVSRAGKSPNKRGNTSPCRPTVPGRGMNTMQSRRNGGLQGRGMNTLPSGMSGSSVWTSQRTVDMSYIYNNRNAVCVHGETIVTVQYPSQDDSFAISRIPICDIRKGDLVLTANGSYVKVECLVETVVNDKTLQPPFELIKVGQLCVTPYHPVKTDQDTGWRFPIHVSHQYTAAYSVYNLVLEKGKRHNPVLMDGVEAITLGHGITDNAVLEHTYFGTNEVVADLMNVEGGKRWKAGYIVLKENHVTRDVTSGRICHISEFNLTHEKTSVVNEYDSREPCAVTS